MLRAAGESASGGAVTEEQRTALADLLGFDRLPPESTTASVGNLDQVLMDTVGQGLDQVVVELVGQPDDQARRRAEAAAERPRCGNASNTTLSS